MSDTNAKDLIKKQDEAKQAEMQAKQKAFIDEYLALTKKHGLELGTVLDFSQLAIQPKLVVVALSPTEKPSGIIVPEGVK